MSTYLLNQMVTVSTRGSNTLDLFLCNNERLVSDVNFESIEMSDHDMVEVLLSFNPKQMEEAQPSYLDE